MLGEGPVTPQPTALLATAVLGPEDPDQVQQGLVCRANMRQPALECGKGLRTREVASPDKR